VAPAQRTEFLSIIVRESERLTRLINEVLDFAKIESGRAEWNMQRLDLTGLMNDALATTGQLFKDAHVTLEVDLPDRACEVEADYDRLMQVVINLLSNAVKFCDEDAGQVQVGLGCQGDQVRIWVTDNGPGINPQHQPLIFERFHQVTEKRSGKPKGTGLGLAISRKIMERHQGRIWVESEPGQGATFLVELPGLI
jgi:signal transduction histidine kinase